MCLCCSCCVLGRMTYVVQVMVSREAPFCLCGVSVVFWQGPNIPGTLRPILHITTYSAPPTWSSAPFFAWRTEAYTGSGECKWPCSLSPNQIRSWLYRPGDNWLVNGASLSPNSNTLGRRLKPKLASWFAGISWGSVQHHNDALHGRSVSSSTKVTSGVVWNG